MALHMSQLARQESDEKVVKKRQHGGEIKARKLTHVLGFLR
jgi:hypothetical protein